MSYYSFSAPLMMTTTTSVAVVLMVVHSMHIICRYIYVSYIYTNNGRLGWVESLQTMKIKKTIYLFTGWYEVGKRLCYSLACNGFSFFFVAFRAFTDKCTYGLLALCKTITAYPPQRNVSASNRRLKVGGMR